MVTLQHLARARAGPPENVGTHALKYAAALPYGNSLTVGDDSFFSTN